LANFRAIWITPLFGDADVRDGAHRTEWSSLSVFGSAHPMHDPDGHAAVTRCLGGEELCIEGGDHSLEIVGDVGATVRGLQSLAARALAFAART
jgi:hypothetical protein